MVIEIGEYWVGRGKLEVGRYLCLVAICTRVPSDFVRANIRFLYLALCREVRASVMGAGPSAKECMERRRCNNSYQQIVKNDVETKKVSYVLMKLSKVTPIPRIKQISIPENLNLNPSNAHLTPAEEFYETA